VGCSIIADVEGPLVGGAVDPHPPADATVAPRITTRASRNGERRLPFLTRAERR